MAQSQPTITTGTARRRAPGPRDLSPLGQLPVMQHDPLGGLLALHRQYGDVVRHRLAFITSHLLAHPDHVRHVLQEHARGYRKDRLALGLVRRVLGEGLLTSEGEHWLRQRRLAQPAFHRQRLAGFATLMARATEARMDTWEQAARTGTPLDIAEELMRMTMSIVSEALLGGDVGDEAMVVGEAFTELNTQLAHRVRSLNLLPPVLPTEADRRFRAANARLDAVVGAIIERRRRAGGGGDLLAMLMEARDAETGATMDDAQLRSEVVTMLLAGHETTAAGLSWTVSLLARHPEAEAKLLSELDAVLGGRTPTVEDLPHLSYTRMVFAEAIRLYPPIPLITRVAIEDDEIGGYHIPAGSTVVVSQYVTHRHSDFWPEPERFIPERFAAETEADRHRFAYFPFGSGPRQCIGNSFALMEAQIILATALQRYRLHLPPGHAVVPETLLTLRPRGGLPMLIEARQGRA